MNWLYIVLELLQIGATVMIVVFYEKAISALHEREKSWGKYCYISGYLDGRNARKAEPKTQDEVLAEIKEKENADQTF